MTEQNASIGANATLLPVSLCSANALIGAGSVVTKDACVFIVVRPK